MLPARLLSQSIVGIVREGSFNFNQRESENADGLHCHVATTRLHLNGPAFCQSRPSITMR